MSATALKKVIKKSVLVILSMILTIIVIEISFWIAGIPGEPPGLKKRQGQDNNIIPSSIPGLGFENAPNIEFKHCYESNPDSYFDREGCISYSINGLGFRGPEIDSQKALGVFRIIGLGDSFTFGVGVKYEDTYLALLEKMLNKTSGKKFTCQVINGGVPGYNSIQEVIYLKKIYPVLKPDLVVFGFFVNDLSQVISMPYFREPPRPSHQSLSGLLYRTSRLYAIIRDNLEKGKRTDEIINIYRESFSENSELWAGSMEAWKELRNFSENQGFNVAFILIPLLYSLDDSYPFREIHQKMANVFSGFSFPVLDLFPALKGNKDASLWVHPADQHLNARGHAIVADALFKWLREKKLIPVNESVL